LFEVVDGDGESQFSEFAALGSRPDSGPKSTLDGRKGTLGYPALPIKIAVQPSVVGVVVVHEQSVSDDWPDAFGTQCVPE